MAPHRWVMTAVGQPLVKEPLELAAPPAGEVLVEVAGCGVCHTDLGFLYDGVRTNHPLPLALGHEASGRVVKAGPGAEAWLGEAVLVPAVMPCGECDACKRGKPTICPTQKMPGNDIHGGFATHLQVPARGLCPVDEARLAYLAGSAGRPPGPPVADIVDGTLPGAVGPLAYRLYRPAGAGPHPIVVYFHGGGWVLGSQDSDDPLCRDLCARSPRTTAR